MKSPLLHPLLNPLITIIALFGFVYVLNLEQTIFIPLALAFFFALLLLPMVRILERYHIPRILANLLMILVALVAIVSVAVLLSFAISQFIGDLPHYQSAISQNLLSVQEFIARISGVSNIEQQVWVNENINLFAIGAKNFGTIISRASVITSTLGLTFVYTFFILYYRDKLKNFLQKLLGGEAEQRILVVLRKIGIIIPNYLTGVILVMVILAVLSSLGLWAIGIPNPMFWGMLIAVLNIIPYIGTIVGFGMLVIFTLVTQGIPTALLAVMIFLIVQFIDNNFLTPTIAGGNIDINPLAAIIGLIAIGSLWGVAGLLIAIPIIGVIKIICDSLPEYHAWGYLLGNKGTEDHAVTWRNIKRIFGK